MEKPITIRLPLPERGTVKVGWRIDLFHGGKKVGEATVKRISDDGVDLEGHYTEKIPDGVWIDLGPLKDENGEDIVDED